MSETILNPKILAKGFFSKKRKKKNNGPWGINPSCFMFYISFYIMIFLIK